MKKIIIYAPPYSEKSGGAIALHKLCDIINNLGREAFIFPMFRNIELNKMNFWQANWSVFKDAIRPLYKKYRTNPNLKTPLIKKIPNNQEQYITIYPEITLGNPLNSKNIVRWLLHNPGFHTHKIYFGKGELYFRYHDGFDDFWHFGSKTSQNLLQIKHFPTHLYNMENVAQIRSGVAYCLRKGADKKLVHDIENSVLIDGMSHQDISRLFKKIKTFISYDVDTAYSYFALMCGCDSVVIPNDGVTEEVWRPNINDRYGIAYGLENIEKARESKNLFLERLELLETFNIDQTKIALQEIDSFFLN